MRDQMDAMLWNEHHDQFSEWLDGAVARGAARLKRAVRSGAPVPAHLIAAVAATGLTLATLGGIAA